MTHSRKAELVRWLCLILAGVSFVLFLFGEYIEYRNPGIEYHELRCILSFLLSPSVYLYLLFGLLLTLWYRHDGKKERAETVVLVLLMVHTVMINASPVNALTELLDDLKHTGFSLWEQVILPVSIMIKVSTGLLIVALIGGPHRRAFAVAGAVLFGVSLAVYIVGRTVDLNAVMLGRDLWELAPLVLMSAALALYVAGGGKGQPMARWDKT